MTPRAYWKGYLRLSLVSCPIQLFPATSEREKIRFHQINKKTGNRIKYCKLDAKTGEEVEAESIVMGYEVSKGHYVEIAKDELEAIAIESTHTIEIDQFVVRNEIDDLYLNIPYYITPDGEVGRQAYIVIRDAMKKEGVVALGRVIFTTREHVIAIEPRDKGLLGVTLRYPYEIRKEQDYFGDLADEKVPKQMLELATHIIATKAGQFQPEKFEDHYERALGELVKKKQRGEKIAKPKERTSTKVTSLMKALWQSAAAERSGSRNQRRRHTSTDHQRTLPKRSIARSRRVNEA
jgi:DNA end-binding protein Ku